MASELAVRANYLAEENLELHELRERISQNILNNNRESLRALDIGYKLKALLGE